MMMNLKLNVQLIEHNFCFWWGRKRKKNLYYTIFDEVDQYNVLSVFNCFILI